MKTVELNGTKPPTLAEILAQATQENIILRTADGQEFVIAEVDDFDREIALVRQNKELMDLLAQRSKEPGKYSLDEVKKQLGL